jgi:DNA polymerase III alpha subunit (gram-positive type)
LKPTNQHQIHTEHVLVEFATAVSNADVLVAHNIEFDVNILMAEVYRDGMAPTDLIHKKQTVCLHTLASAAAIATLPLRGRAERSRYSGLDA